jgi:DNA-binding IclR family transcriptional regulator
MRSEIRPGMTANGNRITPLAVRVLGEFTEMPGLRLTVQQAARLLALPSTVAYDVLNELHQASVLKYSNDGAYSLRR